LTCNEDTGAQKSHLLSPAAKHGIAVVFPDTSPRGAGIEGEDADWDFGTGAGFYLNANKDKYAEFYNMEEFVTKELKGAIEAELPVVSSSVCLVACYCTKMGSYGCPHLGLEKKLDYRAFDGRCVSFTLWRNPGSP
jgi:S-formylglutathione hydrolase